MSNRPKLTPPEHVRRYARQLRCTDCDSDTGKPYRDEIGIWRVGLYHDDNCPILRGTVSPRGIHQEATRRTPGPSKRNNTEKETQR